MQVVAARPCGADLDLRRSAVRLRGADRSVQPPGDPRTRGGLVDADRSETSRAFLEEVEASPGLNIAERAGDLGSAARAIRSGEAIAAVYVPADFERDLKAGRRPQVVGFYNQQFLTAAGIASSGLGDSLSAAAKRAAERAAPKASRIGSLVAETIVRRASTDFPRSASRCNCLRSLRCSSSRQASWPRQLVPGSSTRKPRP